MLAQCLISPCCTVFDWSMLHSVWLVHVAQCLIGPCCTVFDWSMLHRVERLAQDISRDLPGPLVALCVLKGGYQFFSDLLNFIKSNNSFAGGWVWWSHMQSPVRSGFCEHFHCFSSKIWLYLWMQCIHYTEQCSTHCTHYTEQCSVHCTHYTEQCSVHCTHCTEQCSVHCTHCTEQCSVHCTHCTEQCSVHCTHYTEQCISSVYTHYVVLKVLNGHFVWFLMRKQGHRTVLSCASGLLQSLMFKT